MLAPYAEEVVNPLALDLVEEHPEVHNLALEDAGKVLPPPCPAGHSVSDHSPCRITDARALPGSEGLEGRDVGVQLPRVPPVRSLLGQLRNVSQTIGFILLGRTSRPPGQDPEPPEEEDPEALQEAGVARAAGPRADAAEIVAPADVSASSDQGHSALRGACTPLAELPLRAQLRQDAPHENVVQDSGIRGVHPPRPPGSQEQCSSHRLGMARLQEEALVVTQHAPHAEGAVASTVTVPLAFTNQWSMVPPEMSRS